jgi:zinc transport system substrate-binding protein
VNATRLLVRIGAGLDDWSERLLTGLPTRPRTVTFMELAAADPLPWPTAASGGDREHHHAGVDPHIWLDPIRVRDALVPALLDALIAVDPAGEASYRQRASDLAIRLTDLDSTLRETLASVPSRTFVAYHDTWRYFAARYDLEMVGAIETYAGDEPSAAELAGLIAAARARDVRAVILEPQLGERVARVIATEIGATLVMADPLGDPAVPERSDYFANMTFNAGAFVRALTGSLQ